MRSEPDADSNVTGYWLKEALAGEPPKMRELRGDLRADAGILGGGFTGLWTALRLKELAPSLDVAIVEKNFCGNGVGPSYSGGRILASLALGLEDEWTSAALTQGPHGGFPPEPLLLRRGRHGARRHDTHRASAGR
jgi:glycine/D-amino acid oxidase-like deaminating enzyme